MSLITAHRNARKSANGFFRAKVEARGRTWLPNDWDETVYPGVRGQFLYHGRWNAQKRKLESRIQLGVFTAGKQLKLAEQMAGELLADLGFDLELQQMSVSVPHFDHENGALPLLAMELEWISGPEPGPVSESEEVHLMMDFKLYFS